LPDEEYFKQQYQEMSFRTYLDENVQEPFLTYTANFYDDECRGCYIYRCKLYEKIKKNLKLNIKELSTVLSM
jgi:hypothetical protein